jgi:DNA-binding LacI/PurR family transcriptional regulator
MNPADKSEKNPSREARTRPVTIKDLAEKAGVSAMSVSNALNDRGRLSEKTRRHIMKIARELNYMPNLVAKSLRKAQTRTIGVVMSDSSQYVFSKLLLGIEQEASKTGYSILLANTDQKEDLEIKAIDLLVSKRIDGLLIAAPLAVSEEDIKRLESLKVPFVFLMRASGFEGVEFVTNDNLRGGYLGMKHLYETGERNFGFLPINSPSGRKRMEGCEKFLREKNIFIKEYPAESSLPQIDDGYSAMKRLLAGGFRNGAVCCGCDLIAVGALEAIFEANLSVPEDFRLIGYDDFDMAPYLRVPLTTIRQPTYRIGVEGFHLLINRLERPDSPCHKIILEPELIVRNSTAARLCGKRGTEA